MLERVYRSLRSFYKLAMAKVLFTRINKQFQLSLTLTEPVKAKLQSLKSSEFLSLFDCMTVIHHANPVMLQARAASTFEDLVTLSHHYTATQLLRMFETLEHSKLMHEDQFLALLSVVKSCNTQERSQYFVRIFNQLSSLRDNTSASKAYIDKDVFSLILSLEAKGNVLHLLQAILQKSFMKNEFYKSRMQSLFSKDEASLASLLAILNATDNRDKAELDSLLKHYFGLKEASVAQIASRADRNADYATLPSKGQLQAFTHHTNRG